MKAINKEFLSSAKALQIVDEIATRRKSLLLTFRSWSCFFESLPIKLILAIIFPFLMLGISRLPESQRFGASRKRIISFFSSVMPYRIGTQLPPYYASPIIIGFNHANLGDVLRLAMAVMQRYPAKSLYLPVNLVFYEALVPIIKRFESLNIFLYPLVTPSLYKKMETKENRDLLQRVKRQLEKHYLCGAELCCRDYGAFIVAPSSTRKPTVFDSYAQFAGEANSTLTPTMTLLLKRLAKFDKVIYIAVGIISSSNSRGVCLFQRFTINFAQEFSAKKARVLDSKVKRGFEHEFLRAIVEVLPYERWHPPENANND